MESLILLELSREEANILYKFLLRITKSSSIFQNQEEEMLVKDLCCLLEQETK